MSTIGGRKRPASVARRTAWGEAHMDEREARRHVTETGKEMVGVAMHGDTVPLRLRQRHQQPPLYLERIEDGDPFRPAPMRIPSRLNE